MLRAGADPVDACQDADVVLIMTPWPEFRLAPRELARVMRGHVVIDPYGMLDRAAAREAQLEIHRLGVS
jgi:UDPglucose 6-dehydrogenase